MDNSQELSSSQGIFLWVIGIEQGSLVKEELLTNISNSLLVQSLRWGCCYFSYNYQTKILQGKLFITGESASHYPTLGKYIKVALHPDGWLKNSGTMAQFTLDYSFPRLFTRCDYACTQLLPSSTPQVSFISYNVKTKSQSV